MTKKRRMVSFVVVVLGSFALVTGGYFALLAYINWPPTPIAQNVTITPEWTEIIVDPPLQATHRSQSLNLRIDGFDWDSSLDIKAIKLPDGRLIKPEIEIYSEAGERFAMLHSGFSRKHFDDVVFKPAADLSADKKYRRIRLKSDVPFNCDAIFWIDYNPK